MTDSNGKPPTVVPAWIMRFVPALLTALVAQFFTLVVWAIKLDQRVTRNEELVRTTIAEDTEPGKVLAERVKFMDERERYIVNYLLFIREELARIAPPSRPLPPFAPPGPSSPAPMIPQDKK